MPFGAPLPFPWEPGAWHSQPVCPSWGGGSQSSPSPAPAHKLQFVPWEHGSSRGVDAFGGFKLVPGTWRKENKPAETWQGTRLHPEPEGDNSPIGTGTRRLQHRRRRMRRRKRKVPGSALCYSTEEVMAGSPCHPHILYPYVAACFPTCRHLHITTPVPGPQLPLHAAQGLEVMPAQGRATGSLPAPLTATGTRKGRKSFSIPGPDGQHSSRAGEQLPRHPGFEFIIYVTLEVSASVKTF